MKILPNGYFSVEYTTENLDKGCRPSQRLPRNNLFLSSCVGMVGQEGTLRSIEVPTLSEDLMTNLVALDDFPFPQLFITERLIIVANRTSICELIDGILGTVISSLEGGGKWGIFSSHEFIYMSNGTVAVLRDPESKVWSITEDAPKTSAICNFNGQVIVGNPRV